MPARDKALVHEVAGHVGPGTHVLILGIGDYPWLIDGARENEAIAEGMGQLASPPRSARALADWFVDGKFSNREQPLASVGLLLSERRPASYRGQTVPRGTIDEVDRAVGHWLERASSDPNNQTIFFFAGHGVSSPSTQLLVRDYGSKPNNRFDGAINFDSFRAAMTSMTPGFQLFLIDACRSPDSLVRAVRENSEAGRNLLTPTRGRPDGAAMQSVHHGAAPFSPAYARIEGVGIYTEAIIQALNGGGAQPNLRWWVGTDGLTTALSAYTIRLAAKLGLKQVPERLSGMSFKIHEPARPIAVPVYVSCVPQEVWRYPIHFQAELNGQITQEHNHDPAADPEREDWSLTVPYREHLLSAHFPPGAPYQDVVNELLTVGLPETSLPLEIKEKRP
ncbi:MAG TPA: caspase family protein [Allosphingosinicella sp.]|nr:caspase family protein [Allosphingosinicella sp.]